MRRRMGREDENFHLSLHPPNACNSQYWVRLKSEFRNSFLHLPQMLGIQELGPSVLGPCCSCYVADPDIVLGACFQPDPALAIEGIWQGLMPSGMQQQQKSGMEVEQ